MRIKKLDIFGFKSFATRQTILFGEGTTGIVGPNGCGKSNVVDALKWVMGEQNARSLRGGLMQDIIFCGSDKKSPLGFAEVILTMENDGKNPESMPLDYQHYTEIQILRRLYKNGDSDFEINKQKVRLRDIQEFFLGTGVGAKAYSIIEQGRVNQIISAKPIEKRGIIEEAAGITKYKAKKAVAERRIESTKINLNRISDIHKEVEKRLKTLFVEKQKLEKLLLVKEQVKDMDLHLCAHKYLRLSAEESFCKKEYDDVQDIKKRLHEEFAFKEQEFEKSLKQYLSEKDNKELLEKLSQEYKNSLELAQKDREYAEKTLTDNTILVQRLEGEIQDILAREKEVSAEIEELRQKKEQITKSSLGVMENWQEVAAKKQQAHQARKDLQGKVDGLQNDVEHFGAKISQVENQINLLMSEAQQQKAQLNILVQDEQVLLMEQNDEKESLEKLILEKQQLEKDFEQAQKVLQEKKQQRDEAKKAKNLFSDKLMLLEKEQIKISSQKDSLEKIHQELKWSDSGVTKLLSSENKALIKGVFADAINVEKGYETLIERSFAYILDSALVGEGVKLRECFQFLRDNNESTTSFFCGQGDEIGEPQKLSEGKNILEYVSLKYEFQPLLVYLQNFYVVDDLSLALKLWPEAKRKKLNLLTKNYEILFWNNRALYLGEKGENGVLKRKEEIKSLTKALLELTHQEANIVSDLNEAKKRFDQLVDEMDSAEQKAKDFSLMLTRLNESIKQKNIAWEKLITSLEKISFKKQNLEASSHEEEKINEAKEALKKWQEDRLEAKNALALEKENQAKIEEEYEQSLRIANQAEVDKIAFEEQIKSAEYSLKQAQKNISYLKEQKRSFSKQVEEKSGDEVLLKETARQADKKIQELEVELKKTEANYILAQDKAQNLHGKKKQAENELHAIKTRQEDTLSLIHKKEMWLHDLKKDQESLLLMVEEKYDCDLRLFLSKYHDKALKEQEGQSLLTALKRQLQQMGTVNENAAVEYDEHKERYEFLDSQLQDLTESLKNLEDAIGKINKTTSIRFMEAFNSVNFQFKEVFARLFRGGKAELSLTNPEDPLTSGVEILARPPGKNINSIELMSGGEKALTAISLIIAIFLIKPSPFCLLDEVDAPLDDANVSRFNTLIKEIANICQVILITHNKKTMESADRLFGVTMQEAGCSKVIKANIDHAFELTKTVLPKASSPVSRATQLFLHTES